MAQNRGASAALLHPTSAAGLLLGAATTRLRRAGETRLLRYIVSGVAISTGYTVTVMVLVDLLGWLDPVVASTLSFVVWTPISYSIHRDFTFRFRGPESAAMAKFAVTFIARLAASASVVYLTTRLLGLHYVVGVLLNWIALPLVNYLALSLWVFRPQAARRRCGVVNAGP